MQYVRIGWITQKISSLMVLDQNIDIYSWVRGNIFPWSSGRDAETCLKGQLQEINIRIFF